MNTQQARERVAETFPQPFNKGKFLEFSRNLLNKFDESKAAQWNATYVKDAFKPHVSRFESGSGGIGGGAGSFSSWLLKIA